MRLTSTVYILFFCLGSIQPLMTLLNPGTIIPYLANIISLLTSYSFVEQWPICTIGSRDYCHALPGVSSLFFAIQNVWEMTTVVDKIACRSCTACPLPIVLRLFIADISSATVCSQYVKTLRTRQKHGKFYCHNYGTTARPTKNRLTRLVLRQLAKMMFPGFHCIAEPSQFIN